MYFHKQFSLASYIELLAVWRLTLILLLNHVRNSLTAGTHWCKKQFVHVLPKKTKSFFAVILFTWRHNEVLFLTTPAVSSSTPSSLCSRAHCYSAEPVTLNQTKHLLSCKTVHCAPYSRIKLWYTCSISDVKPFFSASTFSTREWNQEHTVNPFWATLKKDLRHQVDC